MSIQQSRKQNDLEKRLKLLKSQVYGKPDFTFKAPRETYSKSSLNPANEISYLYHDLAKILILASIALVIQASLFIAVQKHLISLRF